MMTPMKKGGMPNKTPMTSPLGGVTGMPRSKVGGMGLKKPNMGKVAGMPRPGAIGKPKIGAGARGIPKPKMGGRTGGKMSMPLSKKPGSGMPKMGKKPGLPMGMGNNNSGPEAPGLGNSAGLGSFGGY
jgi:hypothetical protein